MSSLQTEPAHNLFSGTMEKVFRLIKLITVPLVGILMPVLFYSGDDIRILISWCFFSILVTYFSWEIGRAVSTRIDNKYPVLNYPVRHIIMVILFFLLLTLLIILLIFFVNLLFGTTGTDYWKEMKSVHLIILLGTFLLISIHEGIFLFFRLKESTVKYSLTHNSVAEAEAFRKNFTVRIGPRIRIIPVEKIAYFYAMDKGVYIKTFESRDYLIDEALNNIERQMDPVRFRRINRKYILNLDSIKELITLSRSRIKVMLDPDPGDDIILGYEKSSELKSWINT